MRNKHYKKRTSKNETDLLVFVLAILFLSIFSIYFKYIKPNIIQIIFYLRLFIPILLILCLFLFFYYMKNKRKKEQEKINNMPQLLLDLDRKIREFKPLRYYNEEKMYQVELAWFLKSNYPDLDIEVAKDYSRPDIVLDNIAIEIKWPTNMQWLKSLPDKINSYIPKWDYLFIVLFNIKIVEDKIENDRIYKEKKQEIIDNLREEKKNKVIFIEIDS